jgi:hypothetical protein
MPRHLRTRRILPRPLLSVATAGAVMALAVVCPSGAAQAVEGSCSLSGTAFADTNRSGGQDPGESPRSGDVLYLYDATGAYVSNVQTDSTGWYGYPSLACGTYTLKYASTTWWGIRKTLVPTTSGNPLPTRTVTLTGAGQLDFGWRSIVRSTTNPIDAYTGPEGLRVESYDDVLPAKTLYDSVLRGNVGGEASHVTVRFDLTPSSMTNSGIGATNGVYDSFDATCNVDYVSWLVVTRPSSTSTATRGRSTAPTSCSRTRR